MKRISILVTTLVIVSWAAVGCSGVGFSQAESGSATKTGGTGGTGGGGGGEPPPRTGGVPLDTTVTQCTIAIQNINYPLKLIFVVDASGSNKSNGAAGGTDPVRQFRLGSILSFYEKMKNKNNFNWQMIHFKQATAFTYITLANGTPKFGAAADFLAATNYFTNSVIDEGLTPYKAGLSNTRSAITADATDTSDTKYAIVFITDGMPTDTTKLVADPAGYSVVSGPNQGMYAVVDEQALINDVVATTGIKSASKIALSTVYYGANSSDAPAAKLRLRNMAIAGGGKFVDASLAEQIRIEDSIGLPGLVCTP